MDESRYAIFDDDDISGITDINERRRVQNRLSQRKRRANMRAQEKKPMSRNPKSGQAPLQPAPRPSDRSMCTSNATHWEDKSSRSMDQFISGTDEHLDAVYDQDINMSTDGLMSFIDSRAPGPWALAGVLPQQQSFLTGLWPDLTYPKPGESEQMAPNSVMTATHSSSSPQDMQVSHQDVDPFTELERYTAETEQRVERPATIGKNRPVSKRRLTQGHASHTGSASSENRSISSDTSKILSKIRKLVDEIEDIYTLGLKVDMIEQDAELLDMIRSIPHRICMKSDLSSNEDRLVENDEQ